MPTNQIANIVLNPAPLAAGQAEDTHYAAMGVMTSTSGATFYHLETFEFEPGELLESVKGRARQFFEAEALKLMPPIPDPDPAAEEVTE